MNAIQGVDTAVEEIPVKVLGIMVTGQMERDSGRGIHFRAGIDRVLQVP